MHPAPYDMSSPEELRRLLRELEGYIRTCGMEHHGTDFEGRSHALQALKQINQGDVQVALVTFVPETDHRG